MRLIHASIGNTVDPLWFKAPKGFQFLIETIHYQRDVSGASHAMVFDRKVPKTITSGTTTTYSNPIAIFRLDVTDSEVITNIDHKTKYLTLQMSTTATASCYITIFGKLIPLEQKEAIMEFLTKVGE